MNLKVVEEGFMLEVTRLDQVTIQSLDLYVDLLRKCSCLSYAEQVPEQVPVKVPEKIIKKKVMEKVDAEVVKKPVSVSEKHCPKCDKTKPAADFNKNTKDRTDLQSYCRVCSNEVTGNKKQSVVDNHLSKKMMENSTGGEWDTAEIDILEENFFKLGGKELGALKIVEQGLLPGRTTQEINNMARYKGMMK
jgi:hypothetical protein